MTHSGSRPSRSAALGLVERQGHVLSRFNGRGQATCTHCGNVLLSDDVEATKRYGRASFFLGLFARKCVPGPSAPYGGDDA